LDEYARPEVVRGSSLYGRTGRRRSILLPSDGLAKEKGGARLQGAEGEEAVGAILDRLPNIRVVQHDVPGAYGNIDHLVFRNDGAMPVQNLLNADCRF